MEDIRAETRDEILELAAQIAEQSSLLDLRGIMSKRKRDREDASLRMAAREELRTEIADHIRYAKASRRHDPIAILADLAALPDDYRHDMHLTEAWPLAWKGWLDIEMTVRTNSNSVPPEAQYRIRLTEEGRAVLAAQAVPTPPKPEGER